MASRGTVGAFFPNYRGPGRTIPVSEIKRVKEVDPALWKKILFGCVETQFRLLVGVWKDYCEHTDEVLGAFRAIVASGCFMDAVDVESERSRQLLRLAVEAYVRGGKAERLQRAG